MKIVISVIIFSTAFTMMGCIIHSNEYWAIENEKISNCRNRWTYEDLLEKNEITVLLFTPKLNRDINTYPNFLIGVTKSNDTLGFLDKDFIGTVKKGEVITVLPFDWSITEKKVNKPRFVSHKNSDINDFYCNVKTVYYCKIENNKAH